MKTISLTIIVLTASLIYSSGLSGQNKISIEKYLKGLPEDLELVEKSPQKYLMTAEYFNKDIYGNFSNKIKVTGEYMRGYKDKHVIWNNVYNSQSNSQTGPYNDKDRQDYMENFSYIPSQNILQESFFESFDNNPENIFVRTLIWDMYAIEIYAWDYFDSLYQNKTYLITDKGATDIAGIGIYDQRKIELNWIGISLMNNSICAIIEYRVFDNKLKVQTETIRSKGSECYWGKTWVSLENKQIEYAEMYSNTVQEMEIEGLTNKILLCTTRILKLERIN
jgi:hypothetical protein